MTPEDEEEDLVLLVMVNEVVEEVANIIIDNLAAKVANEEHPEVELMTAEGEEFFENNMAKEIEEEVITQHFVEITRWNALNEVVEEELMKPEFYAQLYQPEEEEQANENDVLNPTPISAIPAEEQAQDQNQLGITSVLPTVSEE